MTKHTQLQLIKSLPFSLQLFPVYSPHSLLKLELLLSHPWAITLASTLDTWVLSNFCLFQTSLCILCHYSCQKYFLVYRIILKSVLWIQILLRSIISLYIFQNASYTHLYTNLRETQMLLLSVKIFSIPSLGCLKSFLWTKGSGDYQISREVSTDEESHSGKLFPSFVCLGQHFSLFLVSLCYPLVKRNT